MSVIQIEKQVIAGIPTLTFAPPNADACPLVFFIHGFTGRKENGIEIGYQMAEAGLFCVSVDAYLHGERLGAPVDNLNNPNRACVYPPGTGFDTYFVMLECALHTARDLDALIAHYANDPRVDASRVGVTGFSMGGFATYFAAAINPRISAAVPMGAYPDLPGRWHDLILEATAYPEWTMAMDAMTDENNRRAAWLREIDPAVKMIETYSRPLLMINGDLDTDSPKAYSVPFYGAIRSQYGMYPERLRFKIYDRVAHQMTAAMVQDAIGWFITYLMQFKL